MMTVFGMVFERHGREFPVVNGDQPGLGRPLPATATDPCNGVVHAAFGRGKFATNHLYGQPR
jgi:hypothetical protein